MEVYLYPSLVYKTFIVCNNCAELSQRLISLYNAGAEKFKNTCNKRDRKRNLNIITERNQVPLGLALYTWSRLKAMTGQRVNAM
jgi:hypothetical protein